MKDPRKMQERVNLDDLGIQIEPDVVPDADPLADLEIGSGAEAEPDKSEPPNQKPAA